MKQWEGVVDGSHIRVDESLNIEVEITGQWKRVNGRSDRAGDYLIGAFRQLLEERERLACGAHGRHGLRCDRAPHITWCHSNRDGAHWDVAQEPPDDHQAKAQQALDELAEERLAAPLPPICGAGRHPTSVPAPCLRDRDHRGDPATIKHAIQICTAWMNSMKEVP